MNNSATDGFAVKITIENARVAGLLCTAFEGGVGYWCRIMDYVEPAERRAVLSPGDGRVYRYADYPLTGGAAVCRLSEEHTDEEWLPLVLDRAAIQRGLDLMPQVAPEHWANFLTENEDAETGDVFVQLCLLGEVVYG